MSEYTGPKIFCCGLPRTGTKSVTSVASMSGMRISHSNMTGIKPFDEADFFADVPVWADYEKLEAMHPQSRFVYTIRDPESWFKSFKDALGSYYSDLMWYSDVGIDILTGKAEYHRLKEHVAYKKVFGMHRDVKPETFIGTYLAHKRMVTGFFERLDDWRKIVIDVSRPRELEKFLEWLGLPLVHFPKVK